MHGPDGILISGLYGRCTTETWLALTIAWCVSPLAHDAPLAALRVPKTTIAVRNPYVLVSSRMLQNHGNTVLGLCTMQHVCIYTTADSFVIIFTIYM